MLADVRDRIVPYLTQIPPFCAYQGQPYVGPMPYVGPSDTPDRVPMLAHVKHVVGLAWPTSALCCADLALVRSLLYAAPSSGYVGMSTLCWVPSSNYVGPFPAYVGFHPRPKNARPSPACVCVMLAFGPFLLVPNFVKQVAFPKRQHKTLGYRTLGTP